MCSSLGYISVSAVLSAPALSPCLLWMTAILTAGDQSSCTSPHLLSDWQIVCLGHSAKCCLQSRRVFRKEMLKACYELRRPRSVVKGSGRGILDGSLECLCSKLRSLANEMLHLSAWKTRILLLNWHPLTSITCASEALCF